ncbi:hypothetical protein [Edaphobacter aggregans]|uniref:hypothetical protein n=1 Tax=Edaphobacter aggregans TaxID=570835 RepID=UPI001B80B9B2
MQRSENKKETHPPTSGTFVMPRIIHAAPVLHRLRVEGQDFGIDPVDRCFE